MKYQLIFPAYFVWHYGRAFTDLGNIYKTVLWFTFRFFSIGSLMLTLFSPWRRLSEEYQKGFDPGAFFSTLLVNILMRIVGAFIRVIFIAIGITCLLLVFLGGLIVFVIWALAPVLSVVGISIGLMFLPL